MRRYHDIMRRAAWYFCVAIATGAVVFAVGLAVAGPGGATAGAAAARTPRAGASSPAGKPRASAETFSNPVLSTEVPGPSVIRDPATGTWYAYGGTVFWTGEQSSLHILPIVESKDLVHWTFVRDVFSKTGTAPAPGSPGQPAWTNTSALWTPDVHLIDGEYVMYYAASATTAGGMTIGVATASSPAGPWTDSGGPLISPTISPQGGMLDPDEFQAPDGQRYLYFGAFNYGIHVVKLTANGLAIQPGSTPQQIAPPWIYDRAAVVYRDGYYYLFASSGSCCSGPNSESEEVVGRSRSPLGPFIDELGIPMPQGGMSVIVAGNGNGFIGPSGASLFQDGAQWWMALPVTPQDTPYLVSGPTTSAVAFEPVDWGADGWPVVNGGRGVTTGAQPAPGSAQPAAPGPNPLAQVPLPGAVLSAYSQDFTKARLGKQWSWVNEDRKNWSLTTDPGTLTIDGQPGQFMQTDHTGQNVLLEAAPAGNFIAETKVALNPTGNGEAAGLVLWQNDDTWLRLTVEMDAGVDATEWAKQTDVTSPYTDFHCGAAYPVNTCPVYGSGLMEAPGFNPAAATAVGDGKWTWLRIVKEGDDATAYVSRNGLDWTPGATYNLDGFRAGEPLKAGVLVTAAEPVAAHFAYVDVSAVSKNTMPAAIDS